MRDRLLHSIALYGESEYGLVVVVTFLLPTLLRHIYIGMIAILMMS